jgi:hypothetical protein
MFMAQTKPALKLLLIFLIFLSTTAVMAQSISKGHIPVELQVDYEDGVLVFKPSDACIADTCNTSISVLKDAITHITVRKPDKKAINTPLPVKIGSTEFFLTIYHYPFTAQPPDTILRVENDSIIIHDVGADGILSDSTREYCINKKTQKRLDWKSSYAILMQAGVCPIACFMRSLRENGYSGYLVQILNNGHSSIMYY